MKNVIDLVHLKTGIDRDIVARVVTATLDLTKETLKEGAEVYWPGLCKFTWKKTAKGKKPKVEPEDDSKEAKKDGYVDGKGFEDISIASTEDEWDNRL